MWGIFPIGSSILVIIVLLASPERRRVAEPVEFPTADEPVYLREAN